MAGIVDERRKKALADAFRRSEAAKGSPTEAEPPDENALPEAEGEGATDVAPPVAASHGLKRPERRPTVRRAHTLYTDQDELLRRLAYELEIDKSDVLRQIVDEWIAMKRLR